MSASARSSTSLICARRISPNRVWGRICLSLSYTYDDLCAKRRRLPLDGTEPRAFRIAVSRSHQTDETKACVERMREVHPDAEIIEQGSSYKFCLLAEGTIDYYPRTTHTYEWDTAAAELVLAEAGGVTRSLPDHGVLRYNKEDLHNPWFECFAVGCNG